MIYIYKYLIYAYFLTFPLGLLARFKLESNVFLTLQEIIIGFFVILILIRLRDFIEFVKVNKFIYFQLLFLIVGLVSLIINHLVFQDINFVNSMLYFLRYLGCVMLISLGSIFSYKLKINKLILISGISFVAIGILQYFFFYDLRPYIYLGWDDHLYRLFSTFFDPNFTGIFVSIFMVYSIGFLIYKSFYDSLIYIFSAFISGIAVFATYSRSAIIALVIGLLTLLFLKSKPKYILGLIVTTGVLFLLFSDARIEGLNPLRSVSSSNRINTYKEAIFLFEESPLVGHGFNVYRDISLRYKLRDAQGALVSNADNGTNNSFLFVASTTGFVGLMLFILSYIFLIADFLKSKKEGVIFVSMATVLISGSFFINVLFYIPIMSWFFIVAGYRKSFFKADR